MSIEITKEGGKHAKIRSMPTELPPLACIEVAEVMGLGVINYPRKSDGSPNWHRIDSFSNLDHCLEHAFNFLAERDKPDRDVKKMRKELSHAAARALMALEMFLKEQGFPE